jgi:hypothetical protein
MDFANLDPLLETDPEYQKYLTELRISATTTCEQLCNLLAEQMAYSNEAFLRRMCEQAELAAYCSDNPHLQLTKPLMCAIRDSNTKALHFIFKHVFGVRSQSLAHEESSPIDEGRIMHAVVIACCLGDIPSAEYIIDKYNPSMAQLVNAHALTAALSSGHIDIAAFLAERYGKELYAGARIIGIDAEVVMKLDMAASGNSLTKPACNWKAAC